MASHSFGLTTTRVAVNIILIIISTVLVSTTKGDMEFCERICAQTSDKAHCIFVAGAYADAITNMDELKGTLVTYGELNARELAAGFSRMIPRPPAKKEDVDAAHQKVYKYCMEIFQDIDTGYQQIRADYKAKHYWNVKFQLQFAHVNSRVCGNKMTAAIPDAKESPLFKETEVQTKTAAVNLDILKMISPMTREE